MAKKLWGGRFKKKIDKEFFEFQKSIQYDYKLAKYDIYHSMIHIIALKKAHIISANESERLYSALKGILEKIKNGTFKPSLYSEDIHTEIQNGVEKKIGSLALKLHTLRSRNDQIAFDERFYCKVEARNIENFLSAVISSLESLGNHYKKYSIIGYTHTQRAQRIYFKHYLQTFQFMLTRDKEKLSNFERSLVIYIGAGALKGTSLNRNYYNKAINDFLKFHPVLSKEVKFSENPLDNVSDRDFIIELLTILSTLQMHLSRLAEDFILYSTKEFNFFSLPEEFCTGSSLMPHKKNPDFLELIRGYTGRVYGNLIALLTTMKGLPLTYNRDMQLDKEPLFSSVDIIKEELKILPKFIKKIRLNEDTIEKSLQEGNLYATEIAEQYVRKGTPFKKAHDIVGKAIRQSEKKNPFFTAETLQEAARSLLEKEKQRNRVVHLSK
ncbi:MAG: argininosuccinate lyase [Candidatus Omnitrophica bacterium]|nr:argininosuccinate lyase [Candidatus Omnitrophota bacterium]